MLRAEAEQSAQAREAARATRLARGARRAGALRALARRLDRQHRHQLGRVRAARPGGAHRAHRDSGDGRPPGSGGDAAAPARLGLHRRDRTARLARWFWLGLTLCFLVGFLRDAARAAARAAAARHDALLASRCWRCPGLSRVSLQVRTDQLALAGGVWAECCCWPRSGGRRSRWRPAYFLASATWAPEAALSGGARGAPVAGAPGWSATCARARGAARDCSVWPASGWCSPPFVPRMARPSRCERHPSQRVMTPYHVGRALDVFSSNRHSLGYSQYRAMLPSLFVHALLLAASVAAGAVALASARAGRAHPCCWRSRCWRWAPRWRPSTPAPSSTSG